MCPRLHRVTIQADVAERRSPARTEHESHRIASPCPTVALSIEIRAEHIEDRMSRVPAALLGLTSQAQCGGAVPRGPTPLPGSVPLKRYQLSRALTGQMSTSKSPCTTW